MGYIESVKEYVCLKNGAMYSILFLGLFMVLKSFDVHIPEWASTFVTVGCVGRAFLESPLEMVRPFR